MLLVETRSHRPNKRTALVSIDSFRHALNRTEQILISLSAPAFSVHESKLLYKILYYSIFSILLIPRYNTVSYRNNSVRSRIISRILSLSLYIYIYIPTHTSSIIIESTLILYRWDEKNYTYYLSKEAVYYYW